MPLQTICDFIQLYAYKLPDDRDVIYSSALDIQIMYYARARFQCSSGITAGLVLGAEEIFVFRIFTIEQPKNNEHSLDFLLFLYIPVVIFHQITTPARMKMQFEPDYVWMKQSPRRVPSDAIPEIDGIYYWFYHEKWTSWDKEVLYRRGWNMASLSLFASLPLVIEKGMADYMGCPFMRLSACAGRKMLM